MLSLNVPWIWLTTCLWYMFKNGLLSFVLVLGEQGISSDMVPPTSIPLFHSFLEILGKGDRICQIMQEYRSFKSYGLIGQMQLYHCLSRSLIFAYWHGVSCYHQWSYHVCKKVKFPQSNVGVASEIKLSFPNNRLIVTCNPLFS